MEIFLLYVSQSIISKMAIIAIATIIIIYIYNTNKCEYKLWMAYLQRLKDCCAEGACFYNCTEPLSFGIGL